MELVSTWLHPAIQLEAFRLLQAAPRLRGPARPWLSFRSEAASAVSRASEQQNSRNTAAPFYFLRSLPRLPRLARMNVLDHYRPHSTH